MMLLHLMQDYTLQCQDHCDFSSLQSLLWAYKTQELIDTTHSGHYERFRSDKLLGGASQVCSETSKNLRRFLLTVL